MATFTDEELRQFARETILSATEDIDFMGIAEQHETAWSHLSGEEEERVHRQVDKLVSSAQITVSWPDEDEQGGAS